jgi:tRNA A37 threonylcarbamoyladenosine dehydratase
MSAIDVARRFGGVSRLYGDVGLAKLQTAHIVVIGVGGVGSWAAEALARNAVGTITLIDLDNIAESNVNRQIHALEGEFGKAKITAMAQRIRAINPSCQVREIEDFITPENVAKLLDFSLEMQADVILDCVDDAKAKIALAAHCKSTKTPLVMAGAAGGRLDPTRIKTTDLSAVVGDKLLAKVRNQLRRDYGFPKASNGKKSTKFDVVCVYSDEMILQPNEVCALEKNTDFINDALEATNILTNGHTAAGNAKNSRAMTGLNCAGYGSSISVTATFGFVVAQLALNCVLQKQALHK